MLGPRRNPIVVRPARPARGEEGGSSKDKETEKKKQKRKSDDTGAKRRTSTRASSGSDRSSSGGRRRPQKKKHKRYAWMDSGEESAGGSGSESSGGGSEQRRRRDRQNDAKEPKEQKDTRPLLVRLGEVHAFSDMVRIAPTIQQRASRLQPAEVAAAVAAAARVKYYDGDTFQSGLLPTAKRHFSRKDGSFGVDEAVDLVSGLAELNVYDKEIFSKVVEMFVAKKESLEDAGRRGKLLAAFKKVKHTTDTDFMEYLVRREKEELYQQRLMETQGAAGPQIYYGGLRK